MHILLVHQYFLHDGEGGGTRWNEMARIWTQAGHQVTVITGDAHYMKQTDNRHQAKISLNVNADGVTVFRCRVLPGYGGFARRFLGYLSFIFSSLQAAFRCRNVHFDLVLATSPPLTVTVPGMLIAFFRRIPFIFEIRDLWPESAVAMGILKNHWLIRTAYFLEKCALRQAALINVLTPAFRDALLAKSVAKNKIICIPNGADFELTGTVSANFDRERFRMEHDLTGRFVIVYAGAHGLANHLVQLADAAFLLQDTPALFLFIGDGMEKARLVRYCMNLKLTNMRFLPVMPKRQVIEYILAADIGAAVLKKTAIFKTIYSNKTFDYFSCKKPVLLAIDGISKELVETAQAGIWAEPENAADIAAKVRDCMAHPDILFTMGENGFRYARKHFDRQQLARNYLAALSNIYKKVDNARSRKMNAG